MNSPPTWMRKPSPNRKRSGTNQEMSPGVRNNGLIYEHQHAARQGGQEHEGMGSANGYVVIRKRPRVAAMMPIPHIRYQKMLPFAGISEANEREFSGQSNTNFASVPSTRHSSAGSLGRLL